MPTDVDVGASATPGDEIPGVVASDAENSSVVITAGTSPGDSCCERILSMSAASVSSIVIASAASSPTPEAAVGVIAEAVARFLVIVVALGLSSTSVFGVTSSRLSSCRTFFRY